MIKFGPSGNSEKFISEGHTHTEESAAWCKAMGLDCFEYSFGRGVTMSDERAILIGNAFKAADMEISAHAPYYVNLATPEEEKAVNSYNYILSTAAKLRIMQGKRIVFHPAAQGKVLRIEAVQKTTDRLKNLRDLIYAKGFDDMMFCPETMGKIAQIGTIEEITEFCKIDKCFVPAVDFGHVNAREQGSLKTVNDYKSRLEYMISKLGYEKMLHFHVHFSKIQYGEKGELRHLTFADTVFGPEFEPLSEALHDLKLEPYIICESDGTQAEDALFMKNIYFGKVYKID